MSEATQASGVIRRPGFSLRPVPARWFELLTFRDDLTRAVETLARTHRVELDARSELETPVLLPDLQRQFDEYTRLAQRYQPYWPEETVHPSDSPGNPNETLEHALRRLRSWRTAADPVVRELERLHGELGELLLLQEMLGAMSGNRLALSLMPAAGPALSARAFVLPGGARVTQLPPGIIATQVRGNAHLFLLAVGPPTEMEALEQELGLQKGRRLLLPSWLEDDLQRARAQADRRRREIDRRTAEPQEQLQVIGKRHGLAAALGDIDRIEWFMTHVSQLPVTENFAWVTGWTSAEDAELLRTALERAGVRFLLRFPAPPADKSPPMVLSNPLWVQPFELFARMIGTPAADEADPSRLLVFIVPLLFGYMFGDVGQGLVLFLAGLWLAPRYPTLRLLVPGGLMSMLFGFLFGSVFTREDLIPALWLHPLDAPLTLLVVPLFGGVVLLVLGLALNGLEAHWRGAAREWRLLDAPQLLLYLSLVALFLTPYAVLPAAAAAVWYLAGRISFAGGELSVVGPALGRLLESTIQLLVNTLSFTRVGAFALAHAGLSAAVVGLAEGAGHAVLYAVIMVIGNVVIVLLEGLVVSVQITRLVLFEFFIRFLRGQGRSFRPLTAPEERRASRK